MDLAQLATPCLVLDRGRLERNAAFMAGRARELGVALRPHLKTAKCAEVARIATQGHSGAITVSTFAEAHWFAERGFRDQTLAVELPPNKVADAVALARAGVKLHVLIDSMPAARALAEGCAGLSRPLHALVEVDCGDKRGGVDPASPELIEIARALHVKPGLEFAGVLTHAGHSYGCRTVAEIADVAEQERAVAMLAATRLREAGLPCSIVSVGSTPTATHARNLEGVTEMRPGVYLFGDLDQVGLHSLPEERIAVSVLATVIGHYPQRNTLLIDAGGLALSKDTSAQRHGKVGYGKLLTLAGAPLPGLCVHRTNQEHGHVTADAPLPYAELPIGSRVRVLPNHVCMTAAAYECYHVVDGGTDVTAIWERVNGWQRAQSELS